MRGHLWRETDQDPQCGRSQGEVIDVGRKSEYIATPGLVPVTQLCLWMAIPQRRPPMKFFTTLLLVLLAGCIATQPVSTIPAVDQPDLLSMTPFPPFPHAFPSGGLKLGASLHVLENGTVSEARLVGSSGSREWDSMAVESIKQWRFNPARQNGVPVESWYRQAILVQPYEPMVRYLGELVSASQQEADSLFGLIENGTEFEVLARQSQLSARDHGGYLGAVDLAVFPNHVRSELKKLNENEVSHPLRLGDKYVIYKRFKKDGPKAVEQ